MVVTFAQTPSAARMDTTLRALIAHLQWKALLPLPMAIDSPLFFCAFG
jgi:hypothetical protein